MYYTIKNYCKIILILCLDSSGNQKRKLIDWNGKYILSFIFKAPLKYIIICLFFFR